MRAYFIYIKEARNLWDLASFLLSGKTTSYEYDINGRRTKKVANGVTTEYYYSGEQYTGMHTSDGKDVGAILDASGGLYGIYYDDSTIGTDVGQTYYFVYNGQGDVIGLYNHGGKLIATYAYDAWGRCIEAKAVTADDDGHAVTDPDHIAFINPFRYRGYMYDAESGLYYLGSRYYDPETGRFLNADGLLGANGDILSYNQFAYCSNNPIIYYDHEGYYSLLSTVISSACSAIKTAMPFLKKQARDKNGFTTAYKVNNGTDFEVDNSKYTEWTVTKKQVEVNEYDDLYSDIITWSTMAAFTAYNPAFTAFDFVLLLSPQNRIPIGTYTQYTVTLYEEPVVVSTPRKYHGYDTADMNTTVYQNYLVETYIMGPGNANLLIKTSSYYYNDERISYYTNKPWARR